MEHKTVIEFSEKLAGYGIDMSQYTAEVVLDHIDEIEIHFNHNSSDRQIRCYSELHTFVMDAENAYQSRSYSMIFAVKDGATGP